MVKPAASSEWSSKTIHKLRWFGVTEIRGELDNDFGKTLAGDNVGKIDLRLAPALETLDQLIQTGETGTFDFAFIDADKENYLAYYEQVLELLRPGGLVAIDNTLWSGSVIDPSCQDTDTRAIRAFNKALHTDTRVHISLIPIADGLTFVLKRTSVNV